MGIVDEDIATVRERSDIVAVVGEHVQLKREGHQWKGLCPFHGEKTPSFYVNPAKGVYHCHGCQVGGDVITFVREVEHLDFASAVEKLAAKAGVGLRYTDQHEGEGRQRRKRLSEAVGRAVDFYHQRLLSSPDAAAARGYLRSRGLDGDEVRRYQIGWAPEGWDTLAKALRLPPDVFTDAGLGRRNQRGSLTDAFRGRVMFPIYDTDGVPVGFGGRVLPGGDPPKYRNSAEGPLYAKSRVLYGLNWVKSAVVAADEVIVCEGYTDVIGFAAAGVPRAVATCGTALTEDHVRILRRFARRVVLAFDADAAGQNAAARFYEWERKFELDVGVAAMPAGVDPADLARSDPDALRAAVEGAVPFLRFRVDRALAAPMDGPEQRAKVAEEALAVIGEHPSDLVRDQYLMEVASRTGIDPDRLRAGARRRPRGAAPATRSGAADAGRSSRPARSAGPVPRSEVEALRLLAWQREDVEQWLVEALFSHPLTSAAYRALRDGEDVRVALDHVDEQTAALLRQVATEEPDADADDVIDLVVAAAGRRAVAALQRRAAQSDQPLAFAGDVAWLKDHLERLQSDDQGDDARFDAREQLLAWLDQERGEPSEPGGEQP
jgi:DNA primase